MRKLYKIIIVLLFMLMFTGCWDQKIFEDNGFILNLGIESGKEQDMLVTMSYPYISTIENNLIENISVTADSIREARTKQRQESSRVVAAGKIQQLLYSEEFAKKGIHGSMEVFERDPENSLLPWIVIINGSPKEMINRLKDIPNKPRPAIYINQLLESTARETYIPETRVHEFDIEYYAMGLDPIAPVLKLTSDGIRIEEVALFKADIMVGKIDTKDYVYLACMNNKRNDKARVTIPQKLEEKAPLGNRSLVIIVKDSKSHITTKIKNDSVQVYINLSLTFDIEDYIWDTLNSPEKDNKLVAYISGYIKEQSVRVIEHIQSTGSDPLGIGNMIRAKHNDFWKNTDWEKAYHKAEFFITVDSKLKNYGIIN